MFTCTLCGTEKSARDFQPSRVRVDRDGSRRGICSGCYRSKYYLKEYHRQWYEDNREHVNATAVTRRKANPERTRRHRQADDRNRVLARHGLTRGTYEVILRHQGGVCKICGSPPVKIRLSVDHCHKTGRVRGLLCRKCNASCGQMNDDPKRLRKAAAYLECFDCPVEALSTDHILPRGERRKELT